MSLVDEVAEYYAALAPKYDERFGYTVPAAERLRAPIKARLQNTLRGRDVLEIACGTGYWTEVIAKTASSVLATDVNPSMIALARKRLSGIKNVRLLICDAYGLDGVPEGFTAACAILWWCHVPKSRLRQFLSALHSKLTAGALVLFIDQLADIQKKKPRPDTEGNMLAERRAKGRKFMIVKNIPTERELLDVLRGVAEDVQYTQYAQEGGWSVCYTVKRDRQQA